MSAAGDASLAASLIAVDPAGLGGVCLRSLVQPARTQWLDAVRELLPGDAPLRRVPFNIDDGRLLGGLDLVATLRANRPVAERGVLASADGGVVVIAMAERLSPHTAACLNAVLDSGEVVMQREGVRIHDRAAVGIIALDEGMTEDERVPASVLDRLAFLVDLDGHDLRTPLGPLHDAREVVDARERLPRVLIPDGVLDALCATATALGAGSMRVSLLAMRAAKAVAALDGRFEVTAEDAATAGRLVLAPRATQIPRARAEESTVEAQPPEAAGDSATSDDSSPSASASPPESASGPGEGDDRSDSGGQNLGDIVLAAVQAAIPRGLLATLRNAASGRAGPRSEAGRSGAMRSGGTRGRPAGVRSGPPKGHNRLNVMETLRAAAPWQRLRGRLVGGDSRIRIEPGDFRVTRHQQRTPTLTIFAIDASGSSALNRLAEAKGAVELLLADCYVRRDQVAVVTFRGRSADVLLPPTRSLVRAKRALAGVPGGGGTPLAAAIDSATRVGTQALRRGETPTLVMLTDGRANVARDGAGGREAAHADALRAARLMGLAGIRALFVDTSPRPNPLAADLASAMNARYVPLPFAGARAISRIVTAATRRE